jgi:hypothetical protein
MKTGAPTSDLWQQRQSLPSGMAYVAATCSINGVQGKAVKTLTLKALLSPRALTTLDPHAPHLFCADPACPAVYHSSSRTYQTTDLKVPVFQKDAGLDVPVCYCFNHTRRDLRQAVLAHDAEQIPQSIRAHIQAGRCGCEVNNPQGSCCLGNVIRTVGAFQSQQPEAPWR